jgi:predicted amidophosphoribosyltransferase
VADSTYHRLRCPTCHAGTERKTPDGATCRHCGTALVPRIPGGRNQPAAWSPARREREYIKAHGRTALRELLADLTSDTSDAELSRRRGVSRQRIGQLRRLWCERVDGRWGMRT